ncbi:MAG TPA: hypothetical protein VHH73_04940 [Verrucomicrobiae bacterium]|nr:hypothetical protein [Verrucomicrobiae bacterium]
MNSILFWAWGSQFIRGLDVTTSLLYRPTRVEKRQTRPNKS